MVRQYSFHENKVSSSNLNKKPIWIRVKTPLQKDFKYMERQLKRSGLFTVCYEGSCPNIGECWGNRTATFLLMGPGCTRRCRFCGISKGSPRELNKEEPIRIARLVKELHLKHVVVTSVTRDDLKDGGVHVFLSTLQSIRELNPECTIELLIPDLKGNKVALKRLLDSSPDILSHNIETVRNLYPTVRPGAYYENSLEILKIAKAHRGPKIVKSGIMVGLGETEDDIINTLKDIRDTGCDAITIGQYLRPSKSQVPVARYYSPDEFEHFFHVARDWGFKWVASGPLVRSSYRSHLLIQGEPLIK